MIRDGIGSCDEGQSRVGLGLSGGGARPVVVEWMGAAAVHPRRDGGQADETPHTPKSVGVPFSPHKGICLSTHLSGIDACRLSVGPPPYPVFLGHDCELIGEEDLGPAGEVGIAPGGLMGGGFLTSGPGEIDWIEKRVGTPSEGGLCEMGPVGGAVAAGRFKGDDDECRDVFMNLFFETTLDGRVYRQVCHAAGAGGPEEGWLL